MRIASLIAASAFAIAFTGCTGGQSTAPDAAAIAAERDAAVAAALSARDEEEAKVHADPGPAVYFVNLHDGETVASPFRVVFGVYGKGVAPAEVDKPDTGHHHLLIDTELSQEEMQYAIPKDEQHMHFGGGQTETVLMLPAGQHTLQLVFGDLKHEQFNPPMMSQKITINVK